MGECCGIIEYSVSWVYWYYGSCIVEKEIEEGFWLFIFEFCLKNIRFIIVGLRI